MSFIMFYTDSYIDSILLASWAKHTGSMSRDISIPTEAASFCHSSARMRPKKTQLLWQLSQLSRSSALRHRAVEGLDL